MNNILKKLTTFQNLRENEAEYALNLLMEDKVSPVQASSFLTALKMKGETTEEIIGCAKVLREKSQTVNFKGDCIDLVGTGGDGANTFNISTCASFVVAGADVFVAKHGNRNVSSKCGSADVLECLGSSLNLNSETAKECLEKAKMCFMFAPNFHFAMKYVAPIRKELGFRTIFNILGPLANPAKASYMLLGVFQKSLVEPICASLQGLGVKGAMVVHSEDGLDEISICKSTYVNELRDGEILSYHLNPKDFGFYYNDLSGITGGTAQENAEIIKKVLKGQKGANRDIVLLNAGAALYISKKVDSIKEGISLAEKTIDSGKAYEKLGEYIRISNEVAK